MKEKQPQNQRGLTNGKIQATARGFGFFVPDDGGEDWFVPAEAMHGAMHGDRVLARKTGKARGGVEGEIAEIAERAWAQLVGVVDGGCVIPDEKRIPYVLVPVKGGRRAKEGERVVAAIEQYPDGRRPMLGRIVEVLGGRGDAGVDVLAAVRRFGIRDTFPKAVLDRAAALPSAVSETECSGRLDLRGLCAVTIDGAHSKDFDDAVSLERLENGRLRLGVHIADVNAYVRAGSVIDREARLRGTSVYFADRVIPMLPEALSNGICSLNEGVDRLALSCLMDVDEAGAVTGYRIAESVIRSRHRLVYEDITALLAGDTDERERYRDIAPMLLDLERLQKRLHARRHARGSIDFDIAESEIDIDDTGKAVGLAPAERGAANRIIEECMLLANETVAKHLRSRGLPCLYRVHEAPDADRMRELNAFLQTLGYGLRIGDRIRPAALQRVVEQAAGSPEEGIVSRLMLRSMQRARYSERPLGHFGLALEDYCHFTSPIRRYPDLIVHRILKWQLHGQLNGKRIEALNASLPALGAQSSAAERAAMEAERAVEDLKRCEYMQQRLGETFDGVISGVTASGFYVEMTNTAEGFVRLSTLTDDWYRPQMHRYRIVGERTGRVLRLGDRVQVQVVRVDMDAAMIDLLLKPDYNSRRIYNPERKAERRHGGKARRKGAGSKQKGKA